PCACRSCASPRGAIGDRASASALLAVAARVRGLEVAQHVQAATAARPDVVDVQVAIGNRPAAELADHPVAGDDGGAQLGGDGGRVAPCLAAVAQVPLDPGARPDLPENAPARIA